MIHAFDLAVIGLGYIGLPTATLFARHGLRVVGVDTSPQVVTQVNQGQCPFVEPDLAAQLVQAVASGQLTAQSTLPPAKAFLIAVPTPLAADHAADLRAIVAAAQVIAPVLQKGNVVILESTSPVGTSEQLMQWLAAARPDLRFPHQGGEADIAVAYCPERVLPGNILHELVYNDRIIGGITPQCAERAAALYRVFCQGELLTCTARTAELCKLAENSFRDVNLAFANELSMICDRWDIDVRTLISLANRHPRVNILQPGCGVGGHCIAVDPWFIVQQTPDLAALIRTAREVNDQKPHWVVAKVHERVIQWLQQTGKPLSQLRIACFGLTFKANVDDLRESPALQITETLARHYPGQVWAVEPHLSDLPASLQALAVPSCSAEYAAREADMWVYLVDHHAFHALDFSRAGGVLIDPVGRWPSGGNFQDNPTACFSL